MKRFFIGSFVGVGSGFSLGLLVGATGSAFAGGGRPAEGWKVAPRMIEQPAIVDTRTCYVGTDGALHLLPETWVRW